MTTNIPRICPLGHEVCGRLFKLAPGEEIIDLKRKLAGKEEAVRLCISNKDACALAPKFTERWTRLVSHDQEVLISDFVWKIFL